MTTKAKNKTTSGFDKATLFEDRRRTEEVDIPPYGVFTIRGLSRAEAMSMGTGSDPAVIEQALISMGCVDPKLSRSDVKRWQEVADAMSIEPLSTAIARLSGLNEDAEREAVQRFPDGPSD